MKARLNAFFLACLLITAALVASAWIFSSRSKASSATNATTPARTGALIKRDSHFLQGYPHVPLHFEGNQGQAEPGVRFLARGHSYSLRLADGEARLELRSNGNAFAQDLEVQFVSLPIRERFRKLPVTSPASASDELCLKLLKANHQARPEGLQELPGRSHYFVGDDPQRWQTNVPNFSSVRYHDIYPGIDWVFYGNPRQLEYDFVVAPGADVSLIQIAFEGAEKVEVTNQGELLIRTSAGEIRQHRPLIYQEVRGSRQLVSGRYVLQASRHVGFQVSDYDPSAALVIDPVLVYSSYLGGSDSENRLRSDFTPAAIAVDASGNAYITGNTDSLNFPIAAALQRSSGGSSDAFVVKLNPEGGLVYSTYLGGSSIERGFDIAVDSEGNAYVTGRTQSPNFPTAHPLQASLRGFEDAFVVKLNPAGSALLYGTYLGGSDGDDAHSIAVDASGNAYVTGGTMSLDFPTVNPFQRQHAGGQVDAYLAKLNAAGSAMVYSTYLGGSGLDHPEGVAVDSAGNAYMVGTTNSTNYPTVQAGQPAYAGGGSDAFVTKVSASGSNLLYSTYLGGEGADAAIAVAVDANEFAYVTGGTSSANFPTTNPVQASYSGGDVDAFITRLNPEGRPVFASYLGGSNEDYANSIAVDAQGNAYVTGTTTSSNFPAINAVQSSLNGARDAFVTKVSTTGAELIFSTFLGGSGLDYGYGVALDGNGSSYVTGRTSSIDFPTVYPFQPTLGGDTDAFTVRFSESLTVKHPAIFVPIVLSSSGANDSFFTSELTITNRGTSEATLNFTYTAAFGGGSGTAVDRLPAGQQRLIPDAIAYLQSLGIPIPESGNRGGTLSVRPSSLKTPEVAVTVRTTTPVPGGRAGLAYAGVPAASLLTSPSYLCGLRQNATDRSNVAIQNAGRTEDGDVVIRLTVFSGDSTEGRTLADEVLPPGGFKQFSGILTADGLAATHGYVRVQRVAGRAPYYAYAVVNDQANSDGSFIAPVAENAGAGMAKLVLPVITETAAFSSEVIFANWSNTQKTVNFDFVSEAVQGSNSTASFHVDLKPGQQAILPNFVQVLRNVNPAQIGPLGPAYAGGIFAWAAERDLSGIFIGARTSTPGGGGRFGLFYTATPPERASSGSAWLYGLQQNSLNRTNLALVNSGANDAQLSTFRVDIFDGSSGLKVSTAEGVTLDARRWLQIGSILAQHAPGVSQGYARVTRQSGSNPFIAYAVINDGAQPGERSGDGAYVSSSP